MVHVIYFLDYFCLQSLSFTSWTKLTDRLCRSRSTPLAEPISYPHNQCERQALPKSFYPNNRAYLLPAPPMRKTGTTSIMSGIFCREGTRIMGLCERLRHNQARFKLILRYNGLLTCWYLNPMHKCIKCRFKGKILAASLCLPNRETTRFRQSLSFVLASQGL